MDMREKIVFFINGLNESRLFLCPKSVFIIVFQRMMVMTRQPLMVCMNDNTNLLLGSLSYIEYPRKSHKERSAADLRALYDDNDNFCPQRGLT